MEYIRLGSTELMVSAVSFGALPIQRLSVDDGVKLIRQAYDGGINYFDTANAYSDSELKLGRALCDVRDKIVISTKTGAPDYKTATAHIENSLRTLKTDYIDIVQLHNPRVLPDGQDTGSAYRALAEAKEKGYIRHIGITNHGYDNAVAAVKSGLYETLQFPFSYISAERELGLPRLCEEHDMGYIAMKGLCGGMLTNARAAYAFMKEYPNVVPIWGIQTADELNEWLKLNEQNPSMDDGIRAFIEQEKHDLAGEFCRACGYCLPCSADINIPTAARMRMLLHRAPYKNFYTPDEYANMHRINDCIDCGLCLSRCPYDLNTPELLRTMLKDYDEFYENHKQELEPIVKGR